MLQPRPKVLEVYAENTPNVGQYDRIAGALAVYAGYGDERFAGQEFPATFIGANSPAAAYLIEIERRMHFLPRDAGEFTGSIDENHSITPTAEG